MINQRPKQCGFSMIEVLVTVLVLSIGLLGISALQLNGLKQNQNALQLTEATFLAYGIVDRMRANQTNAADYNIGLDAGAAQGSVSGDDLMAWKTNLETKLPAGKGSIETVGTLFLITVQWDDSKGEFDPVQYQLETQL